MRQTSQILQAWAEQAHTAMKKGRHSGGSNGSAPILELAKVTAFSILEVVLLSAVGYIMARRGVIDKRTQTKINKLNVSVFTPALLFSKVAFSLNAGRLVELIIVPIGFVATTVVSALSAYLLAKATGISRMHRNFAIACAISPNSNSLPVALMQSLVATVPMLHWEEEGEPEDTTDGMLGRALTYLVLFSTLGMFLRWSVGAQLLSTVEDKGSDSKLPRVPVGRLVDHEPTPEAQVETVNGAVNSSNVAERRRPQRQRSGPPGWAVSFPNSPVESEQGDDDEESSDDEVERDNWYAYMRKTLHHTLHKIMVPVRAINSFMTAPLWAAVLSLVVALIRPLQKGIGSMEPVVGALETAGGCSIPLTMVILGAYFHSDKASAASNPTPQSAATGTTPAVTEDRRPSAAESDLQSDAPLSSAGGSVASLVESEGNGTQKWRLSSYNPWKSVSNGSSLRRDLEEAEGNPDERTRLLGASSPSPSANSRRRNAQRKEENRTIAIAIASRMIVTPLILIPVIAWYAIVTKYNVVDDPVFIACACLIVGSPPALTLAQITSQSATGNKSLERLISKTIFVSYTFLAAPTTIILVLLALLIAERD